MTNRFLSDQIEHLERFGIELNNLFRIKGKWRCNFKDFDGGLDYNDADTLEEALWGAIEKLGGCYGCKFNTQKGSFCTHWHSLIPSGYQRKGCNQYAKDQPTESPKQAIPPAGEWTSKRP